MSYTEYLRRKAAAEEKVISTRQKMDASSYTMQKRLASAQVFAYTGNPSGALLPHYDTSDKRFLRPAGRLEKATGPNADSSAFTQFLGGQAIGAAIQAGLKPDKITSECCYVIDAPVAPSRASDFIKTVEANAQICGEKHDPLTIDKPIFVDNTISLNGAYCATPPVIHDRKDLIPRVHYNARPSQADGQYALIGAITTSPDDARKVGAALRKIPYVEKHHGNDLGVNPKRPFRRYQIPAGTPAQLKINDPFSYHVK